MPAIPIDRILGFLSPYIAVVAGGIADWFFTYVHFLGDFHDKNQVIAGITQFIVWGLTTILVWMSRNHWINLTRRKQP